MHNLYDYFTGMQPGEHNFAAVLVDLEIMHADTTGEFALCGELERDELLSRGELHDDNDGE